YDLSVSKDVDRAQLPIGPPLAGEPDLEDFAYALEERRTPAPDLDSGMRPVSPGLLAAAVRCTVQGLLPSSTLEPTPTSAAVRTTWHAVRRLLSSLIRERSIAEAQTHRLSRF